MEGGFEASGVAEGSADVVGQVAGAQSGAAEVLETAVDRLGRPVGRVWAAEVGHDVRRCLRSVRPSFRSSGSSAETPQDTAVMALLIASTAAVLKPGNPSITTISTLLRKAGICWFSQAVNTAFERPSMITSNRDKPV